VINRIRNDIVILRDWGVMIRDHETGVWVTRRLNESYRLTSSCRRLWEPDQREVWRGFDHVGDSRPRV